MLPKAQRKQVSIDVKYYIELERRDNLVTVVRVDHNHVKFKFPPSLVLSKITVLGNREVGREETEVYNFYNDNISLSVAIIRRKPVTVT